MQQLTSHGQATVDDLARRHGFSSDAVSHMLFAVLNGNGGMAQFSHPEFGGSGQWMRGGMLMLSDMFNHSLKSRVDGLCHEIADILANQPGLLRSGSFQSQHQSGGGYQDQASNASSGQSSLFAPDPDANWWPAELGSPNATGAQNDVRYAYFAEARRLAVRTGGNVWVYNTLDHRIGGFSQQQGTGGSITFTSQYGSVDLASLPLVSRNGQPVSSSTASTSDRSHAHTASTAGGDQASGAAAGQSPGSVPEADVFSALERLGDLKARGILTDEEFAAKKAELLGRL